LNVFIEKHRRLGDEYKKAKIMTINGGKRKYHNWSHSKEIVRYDEEV
jgi:hypothetical protein